MPSNSRKELVHSIEDIADMFIASLISNTEFEIKWEIKKYQPGVTNNLTFHIIKFKLRTARLGTSIMNSKLSLLFLITGLLMAD